MRVNLFFTQIQRVTSVFIIKQFVGIKLLDKGTASVLVVYSVTFMLFILTSVRSSESSMSQLRWQLTMVKQLSCLKLTLLRYRLSLMFMSSGLLPLKIWWMICGSWHYIALNYFPLLWLTEEFYTLEVLHWRETLLIIKNTLHFKILTEWKNTGIDQIIYPQSSSKKSSVLVLFFLSCDFSIKRLQNLWMCMSIMDKYLLKSVWNISHTLLQVFSVHSAKSKLC